MKSLWIALTIATVFGLTLIGLIEYGELCDLQAVTLDGADITDWQTRYSLNPSTPLTEQPAVQLANSLISRQGIARVQLEYALPNRLNIETNQFVAACFAIDRVNGTMRALTDDGRIIALPKESHDWQHPILTGVALGALHQRCRDLRVLQVIPELIALREQDSASYALLREIDFSSPHYLEATFDDLDVQVRVSHAHLAAEIRRFREFYLGVHPVSDSGKIFDARHGSTVIQYLPKIDSLEDTLSSPGEIVSEAPTDNFDFPSVEESAMQLANKADDAPQSISRSVTAARLSEAPGAFSKHKTEKTTSQKSHGKSIQTNAKNMKSKKSTTAHKRNTTQGSLAPAKPSQKPGTAGDPHAR